MSTREDFEKWAKSGTFGVEREAGGFYKSNDIRFAWQVWQAATQAMKEKCSKLCDSYCDELELLGEDDYQTGRGRAALDIRNAIDRIGDQS